MESFEVVAELGPIAVRSAADERWRPTEVASGAAVLSWSGGAPTGTPFLANVAVTIRSRTDEAPVPAGTPADDLALPPAPAVEAPAWFESVVVCSGGPGEERVQLLGAAPVVVQLLTSHEVAAEDGSWVVDIVASLAADQVDELAGPIRALIDQMEVVAR